MLLNLFIGATTKFNGFFKKEEGQGMVEYLLIIAFIAIAAIVGLNVLGPKVSAYFSTIAGNL